ncbi:hypothetical protein DHEL01_v209915 [Diaporthe helianthi]|uniref:Heterokaryon incompatibility domain-containing protein n=1 Tax=Diaporthe helianthi TaxID=158607 RepID=A0A2P5HN66_DIAHE|nr:hypothetical protein DHEL01_v209915 [Diaporthe helianthi]
MAPSSTDQPPAALRRLQPRPRVKGISTLGGDTINRLTDKIVRPPALRKDSQFRRSRRPEEPFAYESLESQPLIRLLRLDKRSVTDRRPLGYILTTVRLSEAPVFYALSYCWGSATRDKDIVCNGKLLNVTAHLKRGIHELQAIPMLASSWVWIDQISINQDDLDERAQQVGLMRAIYYKAIRTVVWLGPSDGPCEGGYALSEKLSELCQREEYSFCNLGWKWRHPKRKLNADLDDCLRLGLPRLNSRPWLELYNMLKKPWFNRIWVIQEVELSRESPKLVYGGKARDFFPLVKAGHWIGGSKILHRGPEPERLAPAPLTSFCLEDIFLILNSHQYWSLESLILYTLDHEATDPRDHIFALLGLSPFWPTSLEPDYKCPPWKIFQRVTIWLIEYSGYLRPLLLVGSTDGTKDDAHPSWVPDYGSKPSMPCPTGLWCKPRHDVQVTLPWWRASGSLRAKIPEDQESRTLSLDGFEVDQILWTYDGGVTEDKGDSILFRWFEAAAGAVLWSYDSFHRDVDYDSLLTSLFKAFVRIIFAVYYEDGISPPKLADVLEYMDIQQAAENPREGYYRTMRTRIVSSVLRDSAPPANSCEVSQLIEYFNTRYWNIFLTQRGDLGIARRAGRVGDTVAVLRGGAMPFILRPVGEEFEFLCACVVLKWMDGLAVDMWKQDQLNQSTFILI